MSKTHQAITDEADEPEFDDGETPACDAPENVVIEIVDGEENTRIDSLLTSRLEGISRTRINTAIRRGLVTVDGKRVKPSERFGIGAIVSVTVPAAAPLGPIPEDIPIDVLFEDELIVVVNKPPGMVCHPAKGHWGGTLTAALAFHFQKLSTTGGSHRPGIVHRLDRDTSGAIIIAKTDQAHSALSGQFQDRTVEKEYFAIVSPPPSLDRDQINKPIGVHPFQREKMTIRDDHSTSREASTFYEVRQRLGRYAVVAAFPKTGRTHQIRVHLASIGSPVVADKHYCGRGWMLLSELTGNQDDVARILERQALHAIRLKLRHPGTGEWMEFRAPLPADLQNLLNLLEQKFSK